MHTGLHTQRALSSLPNEPGRPSTHRRSRRSPDTQGCLIHPPPPRQRSAVPGPPTRKPLPASTHQLSSLLSPPTKHPHSLPAGPHRTSVPPHPHRRPHAELRSGHTPRRPLPTRDTQTRHRAPRSPQRDASARHQAAPRRRRGPPHGPGPVSPRPPGSASPASRFVPRPSWGKRGRGEGPPQAGPGPPGPGTARRRTAAIPSARPRAPPVPARPLGLHARPPPPPPAGLLSPPATPPAAPSPAPQRPDRPAGQPRVT